MYSILLYSIQLILSKLWRSLNHGSTKTIKEINMTKENVHSRENLTKERKKMSDLNDGVQMNEGKSVKTDFPNPCQTQRSISCG